MADDNDPVQLDRQDARAGETTGVMRYVLAISLALVIVAFFFILWHPFG
ncbi:MAG: hypothetical protein V4659_02895 [Pseudomonadota bacterium]